MKGTRKFFYGWVIAIVMGIMFLISDGSLDTVAATSNPLMQIDLQMSGAEVGAGFTVFLLSYGVGAPLAGWLINKFSLRITQMIGGIFLMLGGLTMVFLVVEPLLYTVAFAVMGAFSICVGQVSVQTAISVWFVKHRGRAMAVAMTIGGLGGFLSPLIANMLIQLAGGSWRGAWCFFIAVGILAVLLAVFLVRNNPKDIGLEPDGEVAKADSNKSHCLAGGVNEMRDGFEQTQYDQAGRSSQCVYKNEESISLRAALKMPSFWLMVMVGLGGFFGYTLAVGITSMHFTQINLDNMAIVGGLSSMGLASLIAKFVWGVIADRFEPVLLISVASLLSTIGIIAGATAGGSAFVCIYYVIAGFTYGCVATNLPTAVANFFGTAEYSKILGLLMFFICSLTAIVPLTGGLFFDLGGSYLPVFYLTAAVVCTCSLCGFVLYYTRIRKK
jgi:MFS family permease